MVSAYPIFTLARGTSNNSVTKSRMSDGGIHDEPRRASISPGSRSFGWTAWRASTFRRYAGSICADSLRNGKFRAHVAAEVAIGSLPCSAFGISVGKRSKFVLQLRSTSPGERLHSRPIDLAGLVERYEKRFGRGLDALDRAIALQRAPIKNRSLRRPLCLRVEFFKRHQEGLVRIIGERFHVLPRAEGSEAGSEEIVGPIQMAACLGDGFIRRVGKLGAEHLAYRVTHLKHSANSCAGRSRSAQQARMRCRGEQRSGRHVRRARLL